eukprot:3263652-Alexandrium_andersonii.AAC.1
MQELIFGKCQEIKCEYDDLFTDAAFTSTHAWGQVWVHTQLLSEVHLQGVRASCVQCALESACDFHVRFVTRVESMPLRLVWMVYKPAGECCE